MAVTNNQYRPDYAVPPGWVLEERIKAQELSQAELARRCGHSAKLISQIISGKAPLKPKIALQLEKVLKVDASIWLNMESNYRLHKARKAEVLEAEESAAWLKKFPVKELVKRGVIDKPESNADAMSKLLSFFGIGSIDAWSKKYESMNVAYRHSRSFKSDQAVLSTWLRLGQINAGQQECADYDETLFKRSLREIREFTRTPVENALANAQRLCNQSGVALTLAKPLPGTALSGAAWWLSPRRAIIQLSARHKTDDHLWFSLFHEAAHILLHSKKTIFVDSTDDESTDLEKQADRWASNMLVPQPQWEQFIVNSSFNKASVQAFADQLGIASSIVVGRLQHERLLPWSHLNGLKVRLQWKDVETGEG